MRKQTDAFFKAPALEPCRKIPKNDSIGSSFNVSDAHASKQEKVREKQNLCQQKGVDLPFSWSPGAECFFKNAWSQVRRLERVCTRSEPSAVPFSEPDLEGSQVVAAGNVANATTPPVRCLSRRLAECEVLRAGSADIRVGGERRQLSLLRLAQLDLSLL